MSLEILLKGLNPAEAAQMFHKKCSREEVLKYQLVFGGIPKYLEEIDLDRSFNQNMNRLCFSRHGIMVLEIDKIFFSQFKEARTYLKIVQQLKGNIYSFNEISKAVNVASGGGLKLYLENLEMADIIKYHIPFDKKSQTKFKKYSLSDEFILFYFKYIEPNLRAIQGSNSKRLFETLTKDSLKPWMGYAFERFCIKKAGLLSELMGFEDEVLIASPYFGRESESFQIDLLFERADKVITVCEIKYKNTKIDTTIIPEMDRKLSLIKIPRGYALEKALISLYGPNKSLENSGYFNHIVTLDQIQPL